MVSTRLRREGEVLGLGDRRGLWGALEGLIGLWGEYGRVINLTGRAEERALEDQVLESLVAVAAAERSENRRIWLDIGAGGGFPGLVAAAAGWRTVLMEPRLKRAAFLELAAGVLGDRVRVVRARFDAATWEEKVVGEGVTRARMEEGVVSARAVWAPEVWVRHAAAAFGPGTVALVHTRAPVSDLRGGVVVARAESAGWSVLAVRL